MMQQAQVVTRDGMYGTVLRSVRADDGTERVLVALADAHILLPADMLIAQPDGTYRVSLVQADLQPYILAATNASAQTETIIMPVVEEVLQVGKRQVAGNVVRVHKVVQERQETVDQPLLREEVTVERVAINRVLDAPVEVRYEGDTMIVPVIEEVLVVEKRLMLREELHVTKRQHTVHEPQQVTLRREEVIVERDMPEGTNAISVNQTRS